MKIIKPLFSARSEAGRIHHLKNLNWEALKNVYYPDSTLRTLVVESSIYSF